MNSPEQLRISLSAFTVISFLEQLKSWMPSMSLVHLASVFSPAFLSLSGNLNIRAAWTECSLALWLQLACSLAHWQLLCLARCYPSPEWSRECRVLQPAPLWLGNRCSYCWVLEARNSSLKPWKPWQFIHWWRTCVRFEWIHLCLFKCCSPSWLLRVPSFLGVCSLLEAFSFTKHTGLIEGTLV